MVGYQTTFPQYPQMATDRRPADGEMRSDNARRCRTGKEELKNFPPDRVSDCIGHIHTRKRNNAVTSLQARFTSPGVAWRVSRQPLMAELGRDADSTATQGAARRAPWRAAARPGNRIGRRNRVAHGRQPLPVGISGRLRINGHPLGGDR